MEGYEATEAGKLSSASIRDRREKVVRESVAGQCMMKKEVPWNG